MTHGNHENNGVSGSCHSIDTALLELDELRQYHAPPDPTPCFQHAAEYSRSWRSMPQEGRLLAAKTARGQFEAHQRASPDDTDVATILRLPWNQPACQGYLHSQFRNTSELALMLQKIHAARALSMVLKRSWTTGLLPTSSICRSPGRASRPARLIKPYRRACMV